MHLSRVCTFGYVLLVVAAAGWAWYVDIELLYSPHEHMLPDLVLMLVGLPSTLIALVASSPDWPDLLNLAILTVCAVGQACFGVYLEVRYGGRLSSDLADRLSSPRR